jgi:FkbM family methyltransferase
MKITTIKLGNAAYLYFWKDEKNILHGTASMEPIQDPKEYSRKLYDTLYFYKYVPKPGDVVIDIGSGLGEHISYLSHLVGKDGMVIAIEADPTLYEYSKMLVSKLNLKNVNLINAALSSDNDSEIALFQGDVWVQNSTIPDKINYSSYTTVKTITLDKIFTDFKLKHIDYLKMNIEGAEVQALGGLSDNFYNVKNWCVSTHDFCGIPSKDFVEEFFQNKKIDYMFHPEVADEPWVGGYLFSKAIG